MLPIPHKYDPRLPETWIGAVDMWPVLARELFSQCGLVEVTPKQLATHTYLIGATGSGKTVLLQHLIAQDLSREHSICVLDMRGDLVNTVLEMCVGRIAPSKVKILDLREKIRPFGFNPLFGAGEPYFRALNVLDVAASESESWGVQLSETLRNALLVLAESGSSLTDLDDFFFDPAFRESCLRKVSYEPVVSFWKRFGDMAPERQLTFATPVLNKLSLLLATPTLRRILGHQAPIDLGKHLNTKGSVLLVSLAVDELHAAGRMMGSLVLSAICREIFSRVNQAESDRNPVRLYVDEFENFSMKEFEQILAEGRRFKFSAVLAHQTLGQLSPRMRSMILGNVGTKFVFRVGFEDGRVLSRDIFGDCQAYIFSDLPVGHCLMRRRNHGDLEVEVNEPIIEDVGSLSHEGISYANAVYAHAPRFEERRREPVIDAEFSEIEESEETPKSEPRAFRTKPSLENWL